MKDIRKYEAWYTVDGVTTKVPITEFVWYPEYNMTVVRAPIGAQKVRTEYTVSIHDAGTGEQVSPTYICRAKACAKNVLSETNANMRALVTAIMHYGNSVIAVYGSK